MDNTRLFLVIALSFVSLMIWEAWQRDHQQASATTASPAKTTTTSPESTTTAEVPTIDFAPAPQMALDPAIAPAETIAIRTDVLELEINLIGAGIARATLMRYPIDLKTPNEHFSLLDHTNDRYFIHQSGLKGTSETPNHHSPFTAAASDYKLADGQDKLVVDLNWAGKTGLSVTKRYTFTRGSYVIAVEHLIKNGTSDPWSGRVYEQLQRTKPASKRSIVYTFTGAALSTPEKRYEKFDFDDLEDAPIDAENKTGWIGIIEHYFVGALIPAKDSLSKYYSLILDDSRYAVGYWGEPINISPNATATTGGTMYLGPKLQNVLHDVTPGLELTVDFGVLWFIAKPLFVTMQYIHDVTGNWGWAIIILTFLLKLGFYPLSAAGYRSMAKMRKVQPRMMAMKERYGGDRTRMNQAMMELYKEEKINPLGGCLPILVQIPVFISLYWVVLESVELRQAPFALWLTDLTSKDPLYILPLIMGVSMWVQQKLNPAPMDPVQQKVMQILPFAFTIFFMFFPSGLVLYWVVNNVLSIAQQWKISRSIENADKH